MFVPFTRMLASTALAVVVIGCAGERSATAPRLLPLTGAMRATGVDPASGASLTTNKDDYAPGEVVHLTGAGWAAGETVHLDMSEVPNTHADVTMDVQADSSGAFSVHFYDVQTHDLGVTFTLVATGGTSGSAVTVVFTDGNVGVKSSPAAVPNFNGTSIRYKNSTSCSGTGDAPATFAVNSSTFTNVTGISAGESLQLTVPASVPGFVFSTWSIGADGTIAAGALTNPAGLCFTVANSNDKPDLTAHYVAAPTNTAPTLDPIGNKSIDEGSALGFTATGSDGDMPAQTLSFSLVGAPAGATITTAGVFSWTPTDGPQAATFKVKVTDDGSPAMSAEEQIIVTVSNVAPTATFNAPASVAGGSPIAISLTAPDDASTVDEAAGFTYAFDCGSGYTAFSATSTASCPTSGGSGSRTVKGKIRDKDGGETEYTKSVAIDNVLPTASAGNDYSGNEGSTIAIAGTGSDPDGGTVTYQWTVAPATAPCTIANPSAASTSVICTDDGSFTLTLEVTDDETASFTDDAALTVANVAPTATFNAPSSVNEGTAIALSLTSVIDPGSDDTHTFQFDCGSGYGAAGLSASANCATTDDGTASVKGKVLDDDGGATEYTASVTIVNVAPTATFVAPASVNEGSSIALSLTGAFDPSSADVAAGLQYAFDCGAGAGYAAFSAASSVSCPTDNDGTRSVKGTIKDKDGGSTEYTGSVTIANVLPAINAGAATESINEGDTFERLGRSFTDPGNDTWSATVDYGDGTGSQTLALSGKSFDLSHTYANSGSYTVTVKVNDDDGFGTATIAVTVANVAPTLTSITASPSIVAVNVGTVITLGFTDPAGALDNPYAVMVNWDDGNGWVAAGSLNHSGGPLPQKFYSAAGVYTVCAKVTDKDGGASNILCYEYVVVYDPSAGFVTGGGFINSPAGAFPADPTLTGKATFGFVSKYLKGANTPTGNTEFQFHAAGLNFSSTVYQWLVVSGTMAQYKGDGTVNGAPGYGFLLSAIDGSPDRFRIKIFLKATPNAPIYDNQLGSVDTDAPTTALAGGSIVIHASKK